MLVDVRSEIREFLTARRAKRAPGAAGLADCGPRRVPGRRREEVGVLAGVSVQYCTRMERGATSGVSDSVMEALARGLQLDEAERLHLIDLAPLRGGRSRHRAAASSPTASGPLCSRCSMP